MLSKGLFHPAFLARVVSSLASVVAIFISKGLFHPAFLARVVSSLAFVVAIFILKEQGHVTVNKPVISIIYIVVHTWPLCSAQILVDGVNPQQSYFQIHQYLCNRTTYECLVCFSLKLKSQSSKWHLHFEKNSRKPLWHGLSKVLQSRHFERSLFTLRDPAPLNAPTEKGLLRDLVISVDLSLTVSRNMFRILTSVLILELLDTRRNDLGWWTSSKRNMVLGSWIL